MAAPLTAEQAPVTRVRYLDRWDDFGIGLVVIPLVLWGAASVFLLARACHIDAYVAWIPAVATTGVMLTTTRMAMRHGMPAEIKKWATYLAAFAVLAEIIVAGLQHSLPATLQPPAIVMFIIGCLPTLMGAATIKVWSAAHSAQTAANAAAEQAIINAQAQQAAQLAQVQAQRQIIADQESATRRRQADEIEHARQLAAIATQTAQAEQAAAAARERVSTALNNPAPEGPRKRAPKPPAKKPTLVTTDALGNVAKPSPKRDAALRYLIDNAHRLGEVTGAEVDRHIGANSYARRYLDEWVAAVRAHLSDRGAA